MAIIPNNFRFAYMWDPKIKKRVIHAVIYGKWVSLVTGTTRRTKVKPE